MRRSEFFYTLILPPLDYALFVLAGLIVYRLRAAEFIKQFSLVSPVFYQLPIQKYLAFIMMMAVVWVIFFAIAGLYNPKQLRIFIVQIGRIILATTAGMVGIAVFLFFKRDFLFASRFMILAGWVFAMLFTMLGRGVVRIIRRILLAYSIGGRPVLVVGGDSNTTHFIAAISKNRGWGYRIVDRAFTISQLEHKLDNRKIEEVILADLNFSKEKVNEFLTLCETRHVDFRYATDIFAAALPRVEMEAIAGFPFISIKRTPLEGWGRVRKRVMDIVGSVCALILFFVPGFVIAGFIKFTSPGPVFVKLARIGENGRPFRLYKFRSMVKDAEERKSELIPLNERNGPLFKMKDDPRITRVGRFLRRWSLDELPNFYNALIGEMSLVGPRPHESEEITRYKSYQRKLLNIRPGITGLAQISGRSVLDFEEEARLDLYYIENWTLKMDIAILLKTPFAVLFRKEGAV